MQKERTSTGDRKCRQIAPHVGHLIINILRDAQQAKKVYQSMALSYLQITLK